LRDLTTMGLRAVKDYQGCSEKDIGGKVDAYRLL
jgi:hypothetical protein